MGFDRRRSAAWAIIALAGLAAVGLGGCQSLLDSRSRMTVDDVAAGFTQTDGLPFSNARNATDELCTADASCAAALRADEVTIYKFDARDDAARFGDARSRRHPI